MKKTVSRILISLVVVLLLIALVSCGNKPQTPGESSTSEEGSKEPSESTGTESESVLIAENGESLYTFIRPDDVPVDFLTAFLDLKSDIEALYGISLHPGTDWHMPASEPDTETLEILFGNCDRIETGEVKDALGPNEWAVRHVGNKIVIFGHTKETLLSAADYFLSQALHLVDADDNGGKKELRYTGDYIFTVKEEVLFTEENPLSGYSIVYDGSEAGKTLASSLQKSISSFSKVKLPIKTDTEPESDCEICIGLTQRSVSSALLAGLSEKDALFAVSGKKLVIGGTSSFSSQMAVQKFIMTYLSGTVYTDVLNFSTETRIETLAYATKESEKLYDDADIRIMSWNLLCELWNDKTPVEIRDEHVAGTIAYYSPDVIGIQEVTPAWYNALDSLLKGEYAFVTRVNQYGQTNYSTLYYNVKKVKVVESGVMNYSKGNSANLRLVTWALFERLSDGKRFLVTSTHWDLGSNASYIDIQAAEMANLVNSLTAKYQVPAFCTGDYNRTESTTQYQSFLNMTGFQDPRTSARKINRSHATYHTLYEAPNTSSSAGAIDHILCSPEAKVLFYNILVDQMILDASDHLPIYIDVKLGD